MSTKITLRPAGAKDNSTDVVLSDGSDRSSTEARGPAKIATTVSIANQPFRGINVENARNKYRGNRSGSMPFATSRYFDTSANAGRFVLIHGMKCPAAGALIFDLGDTGEDPPGDVVVLLNCVITQIGSLEWSGRTVIGNYSVVYGGAEVVAADAVQDAIDVADPDVYFRRINCGSFVEANGWGADVDFVGGEAKYLPTAAVTGYGATPIGVYRYYRVVAYPGNIQYAVALLAGTYDVILHFCAHYDETYVVDISFNSSNVASGYDIKASAGGTMKATTRTFEHTHTGGNLVVKITPNGAGRFGVLCGIEIRTK